MVDFIEYVKDECANANINFQLTKYRKCNIDRQRVSGYFNEAEMKVATNKAYERWMWVLVHEFCHLLQWKEKDPTYTAKTSLNACPWEVFYKYTQNKTGTFEHAIEAAKLIIACERNCDMRGIKLAKDWDLDFNIEKYTQVSHSCYYDYYLWTFHQKSFVAKDIHYLPSIYKYMPSNFRTQPHKKARKDLYDILEDAYISRGQATSKRYIQPH